MDGGGTAGFVTRFVAGSKGRVRGRSCGRWQGRGLVTRGGRYGDGFDTGGGGAGGGVERCC